VSTAGRASTGIALLGGLVLLSGCGDPGGGDPGGGDSSGGDAGTSPPAVTVQAGGDEISVDPTQYCLDGEGKRYANSPPILEVAPDTTVRLTVPDAVAEAGWSVQVFDEELEERIGDVDVEAGTTVFDEINTSDAAPPTYYLVVVEDSDTAQCEGLSGAWPIGFIRAAVDTAPTSPTETPAG